jgi:hypothetical protein
MAMRVWDTQENKAVTIDDATAEAGIASGRYRHRAGSRFPVTSPDGESATVPSSSLQDAFQKGYKLTPTKSSQEIKAETQASVAADMPGTTFLKNALSVSTFGTSDVIARASGAEPSFAQALDTENPIAATAGQVVGGIASVVLPGAAGALGKGVSSLAQTAGRATEAGLLASGSSQFGARAIGKAADLGAEGLAYGFGAGISEAALGDPNEVASAIILGGGIGAALGGFVGVAAPVTKAVTKKILELGERAVIATSEYALPKVATAAIKATQGQTVANEFGAIVSKRDASGRLAVKDLITAENQTFIKEGMTDAKDFIAQSKLDDKTFRVELAADKRETMSILSDSILAEKEVLSDLVARKAALKAQLRTASKEERDVIRQQIADLVQDIRVSKSAAEMGAQEGADSANDILRKQLDDTFDVTNATPVEAANKMADVVNTIRTNADVMYNDAADKLKLHYETNGISEATAKSFNELVEDLSLANTAMRDSPTYASRLGQVLSDGLERIGNASTTGNAYDSVSAIITMRRDIAKALRGKFDTVGTNSEEALKAAYRTINVTLDTIEDVGAMQLLRKADDVYSQASKIDKLAQKYRTRVPGEKSQLLSDSIAKRAMKSPEAAAEFSLIVDSIQEIAPSIDDVMKVSLDDAKIMMENAYQRKLAEASAGKTSRKQAKAQIRKELDIDAKIAKLDELRAKRVDSVDINELMGTSEFPGAISAQKKLIASIQDKLGDMKYNTPEEVAQYIMEVTGKNAPDMVARQQRLRAALDHIKANPSMNSLEKAIFIKKATNPNESVAYMEELLTQNNDLSYIQQFRANDGVGYKTDVLQTIGTAGVLSGVGTLPGLATLAIGKAIDIARSPYSLIAALPVIENAAKTGRMITEKFALGLGKALTSRAVTRSITNIANEQGRYTERTEALAENLDPVAFADRSAASLQTLSSAPNIQYALMNKISMANDYLQTQVPKDPLAAMYINPSFSKWKPTSQDIAKFNRVYEAVENPMGAMNKFADGMITSEEVQALKSVHPEIYQQMQQITVEALTGMKEPVAYEKRLGLGLMFEVPVDPTLSPEYINYIQSMIGQYGKTDAKPTSNLKFEPETLLSDSQRISMR